MCSGCMVLPADTRLLDAKFMLRDQWEQGLPLLLHPQWKKVHAQHCLTKDFLVSLGQRVVPMAVWLEPHGATGQCPQSKPLLSLTRHALS